MKCERMAELLPDYLQGNLNHEQDDQIEEHMELCAKCREEAALWRDLALIPNEQPSPQLRSRFTAMLDAYREGQSEESGAAKRHGAWAGWMLGGWLRPAATFALALVLLAVGFFAGRYAGPSNSLSPELVTVQTELADMRQLVVLSMMQQQSASERLRGIDWSTREQQADPRVLSALLHALRFDTSVGVRLAALDALSRHSNQPLVRSGILETLPTQQSPLVQVALIDALVEMRDTSAVRQLQRVQRDANSNPAVRQRAEWAIQKLN
jgi:anti-sigma factor RsiW